MLKYILVFIICVSLCCAEQGVARRKKLKPGHHHHHSLYKASILYYLAFLAVKVKIVLLIGTVITAMMFFGKLFAIVRYGSYLLPNKTEPQKIIIEAPHHGHEYAHSAPSYDFSHSSPGVDYSHSGPGHESFDAHEYYGSHPERSSKYSNGRSTGNHLMDNFIHISQIIKKMDVTELTFASMGMKSDSCKKRFVCEADIKAKENVILDFSFPLINDSSFAKYRKNESTSLKDCRRLYSDCAKTE